MLPGHSSFSDAALVWAGRREVLEVAQIGQDRYYLLPPPIIARKGLHLREMQATGAAILGLSSAMWKVE